MEQKETTAPSFLPASFLRLRCVCSRGSPVSPQGCPLRPHIGRGGSFPPTFRIAAQRRESRNACQRCGFHLRGKKQMQVISQGNFCSLETSGPPGEGLGCPGRRKQEPQLAGPLQAPACPAAPGQHHPSSPDSANTPPP